MSLKRLRAVVVDDDLEMQRVLQQELCAGGAEVAAYGTGEDALRAAKRQRFEVALVDLGLPGISGAATIRAMRELLPDLAVLVISNNESPPEIIEAIEAGAAGYLLKGTPLADVVKAVEQVRCGLCPVSPAVARHLLATIRGRAAPASEIKLTEREAEVLGLLVAGHTYADVGRALGIQLATVQSHVKNIYKKLEVSSKAEAVRVALTERLLP